MVTGIAVDASCCAPHDIKKTNGYFYGRTEWRGVDLATMQEVFSRGPYERGTINIGEFLAIVDAMRYLKDIGEEDKVIWSDSMIAIGWVQKRRVKTKLPRTAESEALLNELHAALGWVTRFGGPFKVMFWNKRTTGSENPADYGRK
jgi:ribonuclease HI